MPVEVEELFKSREGGIDPNKDSTHLFKLEGSDDDVELKTALIDYIEANYDDSEYDGMQIADGDIEQYGPQLWIGRVRFATNAYNLIAFPPLGAVGYSFDTTGGMQHITHALEEVHKYPVATAPAMNGAIGVDVNGTDVTLNGCDIEVPVYNWEETAVLSNDDVPPSYRVLVAKLTGCVNSNPFRGFATGEVLFGGARGGRRPDRFWEITFYFRALPNVSGGQLLGQPFSVGSITITTKRGWDYLWIYYATQNVAVAGTNYPTKVPTFAYVDRVRSYADLNDLNIPEPD